MGDRPLSVGDRSLASGSIVEGSSDAEPGECDARPALALGGGIPASRGDRACMDGMAVRTRTPGSWRGHDCGWQLAAGVRACRAATRRPPLTPQRNSELADENQYLVTREARDRAWASRSEARLLAFLRGVAHIDTRSLTARCTTSLCEVSGLAEEDPGGSMNPAWEVLERDTASASLQAEGLERDATTFGTGRVREAFVIYYRRVASSK